MKTLARIIVLVLLVAACSEATDWRAEAAAAIGDQLAQRLAGPLARAADVGRDPGQDPMEGAVEAALDELTVPSEISRVLLGSRSSHYFADGYANSAFPLVLVPNGDTESMFCMVFAFSTAGELVAQPASGNPVDRCGDTDIGRLSRP